MAIIQSAHKAIIHPSRQQLPIICEHKTTDYAHTTNIEKLCGVRLGAMALAYQEQKKDAQASSLGFEERVDLLIDAEHASRDDRRIKALLEDAEPRIPEACIEDVDTSAQAESTKCCCDSCTAALGSIKTSTC